MNGESFYNWRDMGVRACIACALLVMTLPASPVFADAIHVDTQWGNDNNSGESRREALQKIQTAIDRSVADDDVLVWPGVYGEEIDFSGKEIRVRSAADAAVITSPASDGIAVSFFSYENSKSRLENFVIRDSGIGIFVVGASPTVKHVTVVNNLIGVSATLGASPKIESSIFWYNQNDDLFQASAEYSCTQRYTPGEGNLSYDPAFADPNAKDYHLKSAFGRYLPATADPNATSGPWVTDSYTSYCIDSGDPNEGADSEPCPHGNRANMGAYGSTPFASKSPPQSHLTGDLDCDNTVNYLDFAFLARDWGHAYEALILREVDLNWDKIFDFSDLLIFADAWLTE